MEVVLDNCMTTDFWTPYLAGRPEFQNNKFTIKFKTHIHYSSGTTITAQTQIDNKVCFVIDLTLDSQRLFIQIDCPCSQRPSIQVLSNHPRLSVLNCKCVNVKFTFTRLRTADLKSTSSALGRQSTFIHFRSQYVLNILE